MSILMFFVNNPVLVAGLCLLVLVTLCGLLVADLLDIPKQGRF